MRKEEWEGSLVEANEHAERQLETGVAQRVEILGPHGECKSRRPKNPIDAE